MKIDWIRSSFCSNGACVEVAADAACDRVLVRDSKDPDGPVLVYSRLDWRRIVLEAMAGSPRCVAKVGDGYVWLGRDEVGTLRMLEFTGDELAAFSRGAKAGEFRTPVMSHD